MITTESQEEAYARDHFMNKKHTRKLFMGYVILVLQLLAYLQLLSWIVAFTISLFVSFYLIANHFSSQRFDAFIHCINLTLSIAACCIVRFSPSDLLIARLMTLINAISIGFEQRGYAFRIFYSSVSMVPWIIISKTYKNFQTDDGCLSRRIEEETNIFVFFFIMVILIAASHSDLELKVLEGAEESLSKLKDLNTKYEQTNQELKRFLEEKDNSILLFSHETRNSLNILMGNLSILLTEVKTPRLCARIVRAKFCAELMLHNLNSILEAGKLINQGSLEITPLAVNVPQYLHSIWDIVKMMAIKKQLKPMLVIPQSLPSFAKFDSQRVSQILINLVSNSVKFTTSGSISVTIRYLRKREISEDDYHPSSVFGHKLSYKSKDEEESEGQHSEQDSFVNRNNTDEVSCSFVSSECYAQELMREIKANFETVRRSAEGENGFLKIEVIDTGCGITEEDLERLFQKFSQVHADASQRQIGSGLGLWISKSLSELMGGGIRVFSKLNVGTTFVFIVRADYVRVSSNLQPANRSLSTENRRPLNRNILLVADDPYNLEAHTQMLKTLGYTSANIDSATGGYSLLNLFKSKPEGHYEFVITNINMPGLNGIDAAKMLRHFEASSGRKGSVKIGFITGHSNNKEKQVCESAEIGASFYISKPVTLVSLQGVLQPNSILRKISHNKNSGTIADKLSPEINSKRQPVVLCVDDDILNLGIFEALVTALGAKAIRASSGKEAIKLFGSRVLSSQPLDLVLIDCLMPGIDGWTAAAEMKKLASNIPVIGVTGCNIKSNEAKFKASGMCYMIRKPVQREELAKILNYYARKS